MFRCTIPEGVEVRISAELIKPLVINRKIVSANVTPNSRYASAYPKGFLDFYKDMDTYKNVSVVDVKTRGKFMYWMFDNGYVMFNTFGMTGQWSPEAGNHPCFVFEFEDGTKAVFNDPRHFGTIQFTNDNLDLIKKLNELGWDPLADDMEEKIINYTISACLKKAKPIGQLLMDQKIFAGVGNYIRAEALYAAEISPWRQANLMSRDDLKKLCQQIVNVMNESYKYQGATILTYKDAYGAEGQYSSCFKVYGQSLDPLGNQIIKEETPEGRTIHWCPAIQK